MCAKSQENYYGIGIVDKIQKCTSFIYLLFNKNIRICDVQPNHQRKRLDKLMCLRF